ncbi:MAG: hypothetical protein JO207_03665, partial [Verrucomicrobia bacterium]|nr:hypothetical protein [Verrucomicrobiota bacterium]
MLLSMSSKAIYEMEPEIQKLDDEFVNKIVGMEEQMRIVITGGPSSEPIDRVRVITNQSTGELGVKLAQRLA